MNKDLSSHNRVNAFAWKVPRNRFPHDVPHGSPWSYGDPDIAREGTGNKKKTNNVVRGRHTEKWKQTNNVAGGITVGRCFPRSARER